MIGASHTILSIAAVLGLAQASPGFAQADMGAPEALAEVAPELAVEVERPEEGVALEEVEDPDGYFATLPGWTTATLEPEYASVEPFPSAGIDAVLGIDGGSTPSATGAGSIWDIQFASWEAARLKWEGDIQAWGAKYAFHTPATYRDVMVSGGGVDGFLYLRRDIFQNLPGTEVEKVAGLMAANAYGPHAAGAVSTKAGYSYLFLPLCDGAPHWAGRAFVNVGYTGDVEVTLKCPG